MAARSQPALTLMLAATCLLFTQFLLHNINGFPASSTTVPKRSGRSSFLQKLQQPESFKKPPKHNIFTPEELHNLAISLSKRKPGSHSFNRGWITYRIAALESIRFHLYHNLPHPADKSNFEQLFFNLGVASDVGQMPSFEDAGARSGYAVEFFCRAKNLADLFLDTFNDSFEFPQYWLEGLRESPILGCGKSAECVSGGDHYSIVSLGGGPGFDYVSAAVATSFCSYVDSLREDEASRLKLQATILDYEEGWSDLVRAMADSTQTLLDQSNSSLKCDWGGKCDITKSIVHPSNAAVLLLLDSTNLWTCQYCVAENAHNLKESNYVFFRELFRYARQGSIFVLSEVHPRLWPDFYNLMQEENFCIQEVGFNKKGKQMLFRKSSSATQRESGPIMSEIDRRQLAKFEEMGKYHERKIKVGWQRQESKIRGAKD